MDIAARGMAVRALNSIPDAILDADALGVDPYGIIYVDATSGSDANDGKTTGTAFQTLKYAVGYAAALRWREKVGFLSIKLMNGSYTTDFWDYEGYPNSLGLTGLQIEANSGNAADVTISGDATIGVWRTEIFFKSVTLNVSGTIMAHGGGKISIEDCVVNFTSNFAWFYCPNGILTIRGNNTFNKTSGSPQRCFHALDTGQIRVTGTVTFGGSPAFSVATAAAESNGFIDFKFTGSLASFSGTVTGKRYDVSGLSKIFTGNSGASFIPGNSAGSVETNSIYY